MFNNGIVTLKIIVTTNRLNICKINPYKTKKCVSYLNPQSCIYTYEYTHFTHLEKGKYMSDWEIQNNDFIIIF